MNIDGDMAASDLVDMATAVAMEMEEKRRKEEWEKMEAEAKVIDVTLNDKQQELAMYILLTGN